MSQVSQMLWSLLRPMLKLGLLLFPQNQSLWALAKSCVFRQPFASEAPGSFVDLDEQIVAECESIIWKKSKLLIMGRNGEGKTTLAFELYRKQMQSKGRSLHNQIPIFVSLSRSPHSNNFNSTLLDLISQNVIGMYRHFLVKRLLKEGCFQLIIDDVDYLQGSDRKQLEEFFKSCSKNSFVCIVNERPPFPFLKDFSKVTMGAWQKKQILDYIEARVADDRKRNELIRELEKLGTLTRGSFTALEWKHVLDIFLSSGSLFEIIKLRGMEEPINHRILEHFFSIVIERKKLDYNETIQRLGSLSLKQLKLGCSAFNILELNADNSNHAYLSALIPEIIEKRDGNLSFVDSNYQIFFAGQYVGKFWNEAAAELRNGAARTLLWTALYNCARIFISIENTEELRQTFLQLGNASDPVQQLEELFAACSSSGWDGHEAVQVDKSTYLVALRLLDALPLDVPPPTFGAEPDGHITFEWHKSVKNTLSVSISSNNELHYSALYGANKMFGTELFQREVPAPILNMVYTLCNMNPGVEAATA